MDKHKDESENPFSCLESGEEWIGILAMEVSKSLEQRNPIINNKITKQESHPELIKSLDHSLNRGFHDDTASIQRTNKQSGILTESQNDSNHFNRNNQSTNERQGHE